MVVITTFGLPPRTTVTDKWETPTRVQLNHSGPKRNPCISADGLELYFCDGWPPLFVSQCSPGEYGNGDIWVTKRATIKDLWETPVNLGPTVNYSGHDGGPSISSDGLSLYFHSARSNSTALFFWDLYVSERPSKNDPWGKPHYLGNLINSSAFNGNPTISPDNLSLYFTQAMTGGNPEIYVSHRSSETVAWGAPILFEPTMSPAMGDYHLSFASGQTTLYFSRGNKWSGGTDPADLEATASTYDLWQIKVTPIVDFNGDFTADTLDVYILLENWGSTETSLCDIAPMPFGDGVVDAKDLVSLATYMTDPIKSQDVTLVRYWPLDGQNLDVAQDMTGNGNGILSSSPTWKPSGGMVEGALQFGGICDYMAADFVLNPKEDPFSFCAWIKTSATDQVIVSQANALSNWLSCDSAGKLITGLSYPLPVLKSDSIISDDTWHHVALTSSNSGKCLYVDGVEVAKDNMPPVLPSTGALMIGADKALDPGSFFSGLIDDVRIYKRALEPEDIADLLL